MKYSNFMCENKFKFNVTSLVWKWLGNATTESCALNAIVTNILSSIQLFSWTVYNGQISFWGWFCLEKDDMISSGNFQRQHPTECDYLTSLQCGCQADPLTTPVKMTLASVHSIFHLAFENCHSLITGNETLACLNIGPIRRAHKNSYCMKVPKCQTLNQGIFAPVDVYICIYI